LLALGGFSVFHGLAYLLVPMVEKARTPAMAVVIVQFGVAVLAAYGLDALQQGVFGRWWIPALAVVGILPWPVLAAVASVRPQTSLEYERVAVAALVALSLAALLHSWKLRVLSNSTAVGLLFVVVLFELGTVTGADYRHREAPGGFLAKLESNGDVVEFLRNQPDFVRIEVDTEAVPYNIGDWEGIDQFRAYLGGMTWNVAQFEIDRLKGGRLSSMLFALNYYLGRDPIRSGQAEVFRAGSGLRVFRNPEAFPHFWTVHEAVSVKISELIPRLQSADLRRQVLLPQSAPALEKCANGDGGKLLQRHDAFVLLEVNMACKGMFVLSETFFPGWDATIDGSSIPIYEAYGVLRGVVVDAGIHKIEFRYHPLTVYCGAFLTAVGLVAALLLALGHPSALVRRGA
jgi:hypothetical protein